MSFEQLANLVNDVDPNKWVVSEQPETETELAIELGFPFGSGHARVTKCPHIGSDVWRISGPKGTIYFIGVGEGRCFRLTPKREPLAVPTVPQQTDKSPQPIKPTGASMNNKMISALMAVADSLDSKGASDLANQIDEVLKKCVGQMTMFPCPTCRTKVPTSTDYCVKCHKKVKPGSSTEQPTDKQDSAVETDKQESNKNESASEQRA